MRLTGNYGVHVVLHEGQAGTQSAPICVLLCRLAIVSNKRFGSLGPRRFFVRQVILWQRMCVKVMAMLGAS